MQTRSQAPQSLTASSRVSQPLALAESQSPNPGAQEATAQLIPMQLVASVPGRAHITSQVPQVSGVSSAASQPFAESRSQSSQPIEQKATWQNPRMHPAEAWGSVQGLPQPPQ